MFVPGSVTDCVMNLLDCGRANQVCGLANGRELHHRGLGDNAHAFALDNGKFDTGTKCRYCSHCGGNTVGHLVNLHQSTGHDFPGDATFFGDLPDHLIVNCEYDDLAPSGEKYGLDLSHASVKVTMYTELGVLHGHINKNPNEVVGARNTLNSMIKFIEEHLG